MINISYSMGILHGVLRLDFHKKYVAHLLGIVFVPVMWEYSTISLENFTAGPIFIRQLYSKFNFYNSNVWEFCWFVWETCVGILFVRELFRKSVGLLENHLGNMWVCKRTVWEFCGFNIENCMGIHFVYWKIVWELNYLVL